MDRHYYITFSFLLSSEIYAILKEKDIIMKETVRYVDENGNTIDLFDIENTSNGYQISFKKEARKYFLKTFTAEEYKNGSMDQKKISNLFQHVFNIKPGSNYPQAIKDNFENGNSNIHLASQHDGRMYLNLNKLLFENSATFSKRLKNMKEQANEKGKTHFKVTVMRKVGKTYKAIPTLVKFSPLNNSNDIQAEYVINKSLEEGGYNVPESDLINDDDTSYFFQEDFSRPQYNVYQDEKKQVYGKQDAYASKFTMPVKGLFYAATGKVMQDTGDMAYLNGAKLLEQYNKAVQGKIKGTEVEYFVPEFADENTQNTVNEIYQMALNNAMLGNFDMHGDNLAFTMSNNGDLLDYNSIELQSFYDIELHGLRNDLSPYFRSGKSLKEMQVNDLLSKSPAFVAANHRNGQEFFDNAKELQQKVVAKADNLYKNGLISQDARTAIKTEINQKRIGVIHDIDFDTISNKYTQEPKNGQRTKLKIGQP
jgi:hypothetical protein